MRKKGIRQQYINIFVISLLIAVVGMSSMYIYVSNSWKELEDKQQESFQKSQIMEDMSNAIHQLFFRIRGYYAFQIDEELNIALETIQEIRIAARQFNMLELTEEEQQMVDDITQFMDNYENVTLPQGIEFVKNDDYEGLRGLAQGGSNLAVNRFIQYANDYNEHVKNKLTETYNQMKQQTNLFFFLITLLGLTFLLIPIYMVWVVMNRVIRPVEKITAAADQYETDGIITFQPMIEDDEIGTLSRSIHKMTLRIQTNEQELVAQNEELLSQQEELFSRQTKMENALSEARFTRRRLERYNGLSHILSFSLDQQAVCDQTTGYLTSAYQVDLGFTCFPNSGIHTLKGISEEFYEEIKTNRMEYFRKRLEEEPYFVIKRAADYEQGIAENTTYVYDFIAGIFNSAGELAVTAVLSRIGRSFSETDQEDLYGLLKRIGIAVDRIEQYELISRERQLNQSILNNINEGIRFVSSGGERDQYNDALFKLFGMDEQQEWTREDWTAYLLQKIDDPESHVAFIQKALDADSVTSSERVYTLHLSPDIKRVMSVYSVPIFVQNDRLGTIFVHRDITHEHEVDTLKTELISTVSHELRTPLSSILGFSELLLNKEMDVNRQKRYIKTIHSEANRLTSLINDFLDIQRMESGRQTYAMEDVSISEVARETAKLLEVQSANHSIQLQDLTRSSAVIGDRGRLSQVFVNILGNAIKFSPDGGKVKIRLWNQKNCVTVSVTDEGIGIPKKDISHLFEKFYRFDNSYQRKIGGTGLGLSICYEILQAHSGKIWVDSEENEGTTVFFSLPLSSSLPQDTIDPGKPLIIVLEDDINIAFLIGEELADKQLSVMHHMKVHDAFHDIQTMRPAAVIVDLLLADGENGWDLIQLMKENEQTAQIPIVISSSLEKEPHLMDEFNVDKYLTKPFPLHALSDTILHSIKGTDGKIFYPGE